ncbi:hypothetical protein B0H14DRAFT_2539842 [Mycena olivaceomarginata]|nr:hypothetical protein B0H14DRAFT_2539842 [Mycena olivaceomarginata]
MKKQTIDIRGIDKVALTKAQWERSSYATATVQFGTNLPWNSSEMNQITNFRFDYLFGKVMKVDLNGDEAEPSGYDGDVGAGEFANVVGTFRAHTNKLYVIVFLMCTVFTVIVSRILQKDLFVL